MPLLIALLAPLLWGSTYAVVSLYLTDYSPYWVAVWRALPAGVLLLLLHPRRPPLVWSRQFLLAFCNITAFFALLFVAAFRLPGAVAGTLGATLPLILMGLAWLQDGVRPTIKWLLLGVMGLVGVLLLLNPSANLDPVGVACALLATLLIGQSSRWMQRWPVDDLLALTAWQLLLGGLMLIPLAWWLAGPMPVPQLRREADHLDRNSDAGRLARVSAPRSVAVWRTAAAVRKISGYWRQPNANW